MNKNIISLMEACNKALNEGAGAAVTFHFDDRKHNYDCDLTCKGLEVNVANLYISDYYDENKALDGGKIVFKEQDLIDAVITEAKEYEDKIINKEDIEKVVVGGLQELPDLMYGWGWVKVNLTTDEELTWEKNNASQYLPLVEVDVFFKDGTKDTALVSCDAVYHPSEDVVVAYDTLGEDEEDIEDEF